MTNFSFLQGASHAEELLVRADELGYAALAITDECSLAGVVRAHAKAKERKWEGKLLIGSWFRLTNPDGSHALSLLAIARNREGYGNLSEMITLARTRIEKGSYLLHPDDFAAPPPERAHLRGLPDCSLILLPDYPVPEFWLKALIPTNKIRRTAVQGLLRWIKERMEPLPSWAV